MRREKENDPGATAIATLGLALASVPHKVALSVPSLLDHSVRQIKCQMVADQVYDLLRGGQQHPDFLRDTIQSLDPDCLPAFLRQLCKRIEVER